MRFEEFAAARLPSLLRYAALLSGDREALDALGATLIGDVGGSTVEVAAGDRSFTVGVGTAESAWLSLTV